MTVQLRSLASAGRYLPYLRSLSKTLAPCNSVLPLYNRAGVPLQHRNLHSFQRTIYTEERRRAPYAEGSITGLALVYGAVLLAPCFEVSQSRCDAPPASYHAEESSILSEFEVEPQTQVKYPRSISDREQLVGVGVRLMTPLKVQVYTIGLYVDTALASTVLANWRGAGPDFDPSFWSQLTSPASPLPRTLRMEVVREVSGKHLQMGFEKALVPRIRKAASSMDMPGGKDALRKFNAVFKATGTMRVGTEICIKFTGYDSLILEIDQKPRMILENKALVWALLDMFLGDSPVAPNVKSRIAQGFDSLLVI